MATGDTATSAGLDLVSGSALANTLDTEENKTRDYIGQVILNHPRKVTVSTTAPTSPQEGDVWIKVT